MTQSASIPWLSQIHHKWQSCLPGMPLACREVVAEFAELHCNVLRHRPAHAGLQACLQGWRLAFQRRLNLLDPPVGVRTGSVGGHAPQAHKQIQVLCLHGCHQSFFEGCVQGQLLTLAPSTPASAIETTCQSNTDHCQASKDLIFMPCITR